MARVEGEVLRHAGGIEVKHDEECGADPRWINSVGGKGDIKGSEELLETVDYPRRLRAWSRARMDLEHRVECGRGNGY